MIATCAPASNYAVATVLLSHLLSMLADVIELYTARVQVRMAIVLCRIPAITPLPLSCKALSVSVSERWDMSERDSRAFSMCWSSITSEGNICS